METPTQGTRTIVTFRLAGEEHGIPVERVFEVLAQPKLTRVPTTPEWIRGIMHLRGGVVPVLDLAAKLGLGQTPIERRTCVVLLDSEALGERRTVGLLVERAERLLEVEPEAIEAAPTFGTRISVDYLTGLVRTGESYVLLLEIEKALSARELAVLQRAGAEPAAEADP
ncbi:MAG TPA: chemotaxis protein CheW [Acidobacteria bacterium]|nr:chemotaxis protein CheW [Acidobacteriota bacterium]